MTSDPSNPAEVDVTDSVPLLYRKCGCWVPAVICILACLSIPTAFFLGRIVESGTGKHLRAMREVKRMEALFAKHPDKFGDLYAHEISGGIGVAAGTVSTQADYEFLVSRIQLMFGDEWGNLRYYQVEVNQD